MTRVACRGFPPPRGPRRTSPSSSPLRRHRSCLLQDMSKNPSMSEDLKIAELSNRKRAVIIGNLCRFVAFSGFLAIPAIGYAQAGPPGPPADEGRGDVAKVHVSCAADADRFCKDAKAGHGHVRECLKAHEADLSDGCRAALQDASEHQHPHPHP
jgi:hypothetical protein